MFVSGGDWEQHVMLAVWESLERRQRMDSWGSVGAEMMRCPSLCAVDWERTHCSVYRRTGSGFLLVSVCCLVVCCRPGSMSSVAERGWRKSQLINRSRNQISDIGKDLGNVIHWSDYRLSNPCRYSVQCLFSWWGWKDNVCIVLHKGFTYCGHCGNLACCGGSARLYGYSKPVPHYR